MTLPVTPAKLHEVHLRGQSKLQLHQTPEVFQIWTLMSC